MSAASNSGDAASVLSLVEDEYPEQITTPDYDSVETLRRAKADTFIQLGALPEGTVDIAALVELLNRLFFKSCEDEVHVRSLGDAVGINSAKIDYLEAEVSLYITLYCLYIVLPSCMFARLVILLGTILSFVSWSPRSHSGIRSISGRRRCTSFVT